MKNQYRISKLIAKYYLNTILKAENEELQHWLNSNKNNDKLFKNIIKEKNLSKTVEVLKSIDSVKELDENYKRITKKNFKRKNYIKWMSYAAAILIPLFVITYLSLNLSGYKQENILKQLSSVYSSKISKTLLIDESGNSYKLDKELSLISRDSTFSIRNTSQSIKYVSSTQKRFKMKEVYHTLIVPTGGEYLLELRDGTKIWINSETEIRYPKYMLTDTRIVELKGEAYFEVAENVNKPFIVKTNGVAIKVLGTAFNVSAYKNENHITTTLVSGKVNVSSYNEQMTLEPGYQSVFEHDTFKKYKVDTQYFTDWKNGIFRFKNIRLYDLTNKLNRWYGVQFFFDSEKLKNIKFNGAVKKDEPLSVILKILKKTNYLNYEVSDNAILITK